MLSRLERAFERIVEGSIAGAFRLRVQPAEIGRQLERAMLDSRVSSVGVTLAPNHFDVRLHPDDAAAFADWEAALCREMESFLSELAFARGIATVGPIRVRMIEDARVRRRAVQAVARFDADRQAEARPTAVGRSLLRLEPAAPGFPALALDARRLTVGRAAENDLVLADPEVSRHHARLEADGDGWRVVDLDSTNGTWVNGARVVEARIDDGDTLAFAGVRYLIVAE